MTQSPAPTVSVCIPAYRGAQLLGRTIDTVLTQTYADLELVIIDDNSPDDTAAVVARYHDPRIRFLRNSNNLGPEGNWNRCLAEARGRYFKLLPQDDPLAPTCLERQVGVLEEDASRRIGLVFCARTIIDAHDKVITTRRYPGRATGAIAGPIVIRQCMRYGTNLIGEPGSVMFRRDLANEIGPFDARFPYVIDLEYWSRLLLAGDAYYLPEALASFRVSRGSWSVAIGARQSGDFCRFIAKLARDPRLKVSTFEILAGNVMARINNVLRIFFYYLFIKRAL